MPQLRQNPITGEWVVIAPGRAKRPEDFVMAAAEKRTTDLNGCPFCPGGTAFATKLPDIKNRYFYVLPNKYPAFTDEDVIEAQSDSQLFFATSSLGSHEVISTFDHHTEMTEFSQPFWQE
ncbi:MAG: UDPglucose--hexose-1-phosphate uridylyltransferase, partial [Candidatus Berkelbacteria bacterium Licking1014_2]